MRTKIWLLLHCLLLAVPATAAVFHAPDVRLFGVEASPGPPTWSVHEWWTEHLQKSLTSDFEAHLGFRGVLVRTDNTLLHASLGEAKPEADVKIGLNDTLFIGDDLTFASKRPEDLPSAEHLARIAELTGELQRKLARSGSRLVVVVSPSKTWLYPEAIPSAWRRKQSSPTPPDAWVHGQLVDGLRRNGVVFTDGVELLRSEHERDLVFTRPGRHWTNVGACRVVAAAAPDLFPHRCAYTWKYVDPENPWFADFDLFRLLDAWHPRYVPPAIPVLDAVPRREHGPSAVFVGTSFSWMMVDSMRPYLGHVELFFYDRTIYDMTEEKKSRELGPIDPSSPTWPSHALGKDIYVLELFGPYVDGGYAMSFLETMVARVP